MKLIMNTLFIIKKRAIIMQYLDQATWSTRNWTSLQVRRVSIALHRAVAWEIADELGHGATRDLRLGDFVAEA